MRVFLIWQRVLMTGAVSALVFLLAGCGDGGGGRQFLSIGTAGTGGIYYPLGGAIASRLSIADPDRQYTAEVTGGSVENMNDRLRGVPRRCRFRSTTLRPQGNRAPVRQRRACGSARQLERYVCWRLSRQTCLRGCTRKWHRATRETVASRVRHHLRRCRDSLPVVPRVGQRSPRWSDRCGYHLRRIPGLVCPGGNNDRCGAATPGGFGAHRNYE